MYTSVSRVYILVMKVHSKVAPYCATLVIWANEYLACCTPCAMLTSFIFASAPAILPGAILAAIVTVNCKINCPLWFCYESKEPLHSAASYAKVVDHFHGRQKMVYIFADALRRACE